MGKYDPLRRFLKNAVPNVSKITLSFRQIEQILVDVLPPSTQQHRSWWANECGPSAHIQAKSWLSAGWKMETVDQIQDWVRFRRLR